MRNPPAGAARACSLLLFFSFSFLPRPKGHANQAIVAKWIYFMFCSRASEPSRFSGGELRGHYWSAASKAPTPIAIDTLYFVTIAALLIVAALRPQISG